ncbi:MAG: hypothetical protein LC725_04950 [Lentisphaerae bacterium]|nr:hypothetical protein [Lentisphaerota bacterium]
MCKMLWGGMIRLWIAALVLPSAVFAQIQVRSYLPETQFLLNESTPLTVTIANYSGRLLTIDGGRAGAELRLEMENSQGRVVRPLPEGARISELAPILPGETGRYEFDLSRMFEIQALERYTVRAVVDLGTGAFASPDVKFEVMRGFELARMRAGVKGDPDALRNYVLEYFQRSSGEYLYLRIEDVRNRSVFGVFKLGSLVRIRAPELVLDESSNVHVLFYSKNMLAVHTAVTPYGVVLFSEAHQALRGDARLIKNDAGRVVLTRSVQDVSLE